MSASVDEPPRVPALVCPVCTEPQAFMYMLMPCGHGLCMDCLSAEMRVTREHADARAVLSRHQCAECRTETVSVLAPAQCQLLRSQGEAIDPAAYAEGLRKYKMLLEFVPKLERGERNEGSVLAMFLTLHRNFDVLECELRKKRDAEKEVEEARAAHKALRECDAGSVASRVRARNGRSSLEHTKDEFAAECRVHQLRAARDRVVKLGKMLVYTGHLDESAMGGAAAAATPASTARQVVTGMLLNRSSGLSQPSDTSSSDESVFDRESVTSFDSESSSDTDWD